jgi:hypothetical protein
MLDLDRRTVRIAPDHPPLDDQIHRALVIYQRRPLHAYFHTLANAKGALGGKPDAAAADIQDLAYTLIGNSVSRPVFVADVLPDWKPLACALLGGMTDRFSL